ncbi:hypothetical protein MKP15_04175 [Stenotrophomonas sp. Y6]|uniref:hypothetical protein n=1 Tax=Stenotrophomonas sp. Y6 TaxID=2920383 RepID=UPI001F05F844|nr:hypothetical protein [Stenotrophomonas sp. Y6]MCH1907969.1 hypothetical protein [Stenotrophomonas sp. Y6]
MSTVYVVMAVTTSPCAFNVPYPVAVFDTRVEANAFAANKNAKATRLDYYVSKAKRGAA